MYLLEDAIMGLVIFKKFIKLCVYIVNVDEWNIWWIRSTDG